MSADILKRREIATKKFVYPNFMAVEEIQAHRGGFKDGFTDQCVKDLVDNSYHAMWCQFRQNIDCNCGLEKAIANYTAAVKELEG